MKTDEVIKHLREANTFAEKAYWIIANINSDDAQLVGLTDTLKELRQLLTIADALSKSIIIQLKRQEL